jgi:hypothetical protein
MDVIVAKATFNAQVAEVDLVIETAVDAKNNVLVDVQVDLAANATVGAGSMNNTVGL